MSLEREFDAAWNAVLADDSLAGIRSKLSVHELRELMRIAVPATAAVGRGLNETVVTGRRTFRQMYREQREVSKALEAALASAVEGLEQERERTAFWPGAPKHPEIDAQLADLDNRIASGREALAKARGEQP